MNDQNIKKYTINENGSIVVHNYCAAERRRITVTFAPVRLLIDLAAATTAHEVFLVSCSTIWQRR